MKVMSHALLLMAGALPMSLPGFCDAEDPARAVAPQDGVADRDRWVAQRDTLTPLIDADPKNLRLVSERGDVHFFLGDFASAVRDYDRMVEIDAEQDASHWRRGIALFYVGDFPKAAAQFERYHSFDQVDRENGIWRYLSQRKAHGLKVAREGLLKYEKDDREPFPDVYRLFAGEIEPAAILERIDKAAIDADEREKRRFYAELYIGLNEAVEGRNDSAETHLTRAAANTWGPRAGYGPHYMWQVGRLHLASLKAATPRP
jgi:lipoprotein NlpI